VLGLLCFHALCLLILCARLRAGRHAGQRPSGVPNAPGVIGGVFGTQFGTVRQAFGSHFTGVGKAFGSVRQIVRQAFGRAFGTLY
jgi:hypothetical protein